MLFTVPRFLSGFWAYLKKKGLVTGLPYGEVGLFAASMGVLMYCYQFEEEKIKKSYLSIFKKLWGANCASCHKADGGGQLPGDKLALLEK